MKKGRSIDSYTQSALSTSAPLAWLYVSVLAASYAACTHLLHYHAPVNGAVWTSFSQQVPASVFQWQLAAFGAVMVLNVINLMFCSTPVQYNCNVLLSLIHGVAFATDWLIEAQATSVVVSWGGHMFIPVRYVQWLHTTPTMLLIMSMMGDTSASQLTLAVLGDLVMVLTGLGASWTDGRPQMLMLGVSFAGFIIVMRAVISMFMSAIAESSADHTARLLLGRMLALTLLVWALFPLVWLAAYGGLIDIVWEQILWGVSDYSAKVVFSSHLWQKNLATVQQRREAAQELMGVLDRGLLLERVRALVASKEKLVYALSHELRAPINGMLALVQELLHNKTQSAASRTKMLMMIRSSATCLLNTINTTINGSAGAGASLTAAGAPAGPKRMHVVNLHRVAEAVLRLTRPMVKEHVRLVNCISKDMPKVKGESMRLMQVMMNLVCTSLKLTHTGDIKVSATATQSTVQVVVADTGQGLSPEQLQKALNPFDHAEGEHADVWEVCRSGLGLYLVQQALSSMGSSIKATSELGKGSTFMFELVLADDDCESESEAENTDMWSEAGSLRASLEMAELDASSLRPPRSSSDSQQTRSSVDMSQHGGSRIVPVSTTAGSSLLATASGTTTATSSVISAMDAATPAAAAAMSDAAGVIAADSRNQSEQQQGPMSESVSMDAAAAAAISSGLNHTPQKPSHRRIHNGVIQVLSVDDDPVNQLVATTSLRSNKWDVKKCMSGSEALAWLAGAEAIPDLVLLDVMMPSMSGFEVARRIREQYPSSVLPIIMVSAKTEEDDIVKGLHCGADDYISKPFKRAELSARIRAHIRARDAFQQQQAAEQQWLLQHNLLPASVQRKLRAGETVIAESHADATVIWAEVIERHAAAATTLQNNSRDRDINCGPDSNGGLIPSSSTTAGDGSSEAAGDGAASAAVVDSRSSTGACISGGVGLSAAEAVVTLNSLYTTWEELCAQQDVLGVDFSGSTFVAVSGHDDNPQHLHLIMKTAQAMLAVAAGMTHADGAPLAVRLGIHVGPLTTGLVGSKAVKLVLMGDTVEVAKQLAVSGGSGGCHISAAVYERIKALPGDMQAAAAAMPWTLQHLPGSSGMQHTYLLWGSGSPGLPTAGQQQQQQQEGAFSLKLEAQQHQQDAGILTVSKPPATVSGKADAEGVEAAAGAAASVLGVSTSSTTANAPNGVAHEVSAGRLSRFLRLGSKAAAAADNSSNTAADPGSAVASSAPSTSSVTTTGPAAGTSNNSSNHSSSMAAATSSLTTTAAAAIASPLVTAALPVPPPPSCGSSGFMTAAMRSNSGGSWASLPISSSRDARGLVPGASAAAAAAGGGGAGVLSPGGVDQEITAESWLLADRMQQQCVARPSAVSGTLLAQPSVSSGNGSRDESQRHESLQQQHHQQQHMARPQAAANASQLQPQQSASTAATLIQELTTERRQLHDQLLVHVQQHAAATAELSCVREQLEESKAQLSSQAHLVEQLKQQLGQAMLRAHLGDCSRALLQMKAQINSFTAMAAAPPVGGSAVGALPSQQQQQQQLLQTAVAHSVMSDSPGTSREGGDQCDPQQLSAQPPLLSSAARGGSGGNVYQGVPATAASSSSLNPAVLHQLLATQAAQLAHLQQQQLVLSSALQQQQRQGASPTTAAGPENMDCLSEALDASSHRTA